MKGRLQLSYVLTLCLVFILAIAMPLMARAAVIEEWVARYKSPGSDYDQASAIAVDASGNVYVTGCSEGSGTDIDYATVKYDHDGNELWVQRYNGPGNGEDVAHAISVDASGNVYVTGESHGSGTGEDCATVKYDTNGNELWVRRYNGPGNYRDEAHAIAIDVSGNVYVTGESYGSGTYSDYATVKYSQPTPDTVEEEWVARYDGPGKNHDVANAIAVDALGNIYVTGRSEGSGTYSDYATVKYDPHGEQLWETRYNGQGDGDDYARAIVLDVSGNVYVTGQCEGNYATVKYDTKGNELWVKQYDGPGNGVDSANALVIDVSGNVYVTGFSPGIGTGSDYATIKYDSAGNELWMQRYSGPGNGSDYARAIAVDTCGNVYVTGESDGNGTGRDYATVKYDTNGNELWVKRYNLRERCTIKP